MTDLPDRPTFEHAYAGKASWDIGRPQPAFVAVADQIHGSILDLGCGTGENALYFAQRGHKVAGIDYLVVPIERAKQKAQERGGKTEFLVGNALELPQLISKFDSVLDCGLFHVFSDEDRVRYLQGLPRVLKPGGKLFLLCFSDAEPGNQGPRRITQQELHTAFAQGWRIESIQAARFEVIPDLPDITFSEGGPKAWFVVAERLGQ